MTKLSRPKSTRDYAKSKRKKRQGATRADRANNASLVPAWLWMVLGLSLGIFITALFFLKNPLSKSEPPTTKVERAKSTKYEAIDLDKAKPEPYSFREILEKKTIDVEVEPLAPKGTFIMQCGSFRDPESADSLKAQLAMLGFEANIKSSTNDKGLWYRVLIGPYNSKRTAENDRHQLQANAIHHCKIW